MSEVPGR